MTKELIRGERGHSYTGQVDFNPIEHKYHLLHSRRLKQAQNKPRAKLPIVLLGEVSGNWAAVIFSGHGLAAGDVY